jgi:hypothetical protein
VIAGDVESVRRRLAYALESLGYTVVSENPLQARRAALKGALTADFTEHTRRLSVALRPAGETATGAVFDFVVVHAGCMTEGDNLTLEREADAVIAVAESSAAPGVCRSCGTENGADARFCRLCGAPSAAGAPAELEVLRLTAGARAGLQEIVGGLGIALITAVGCLLLVLFGSAKGARAAFYLLAVGEFVGWWMALYGVLRLHRTLNRAPEARTPPAAAHAPQQLPAAQTPALTPSHFSVTEGTTELLNTPAREREREPVRARRGEQGDTSPIS